MLERIACEASQRYQREHVTPALYEAGSSFRVLHVRSEREGLGQERWTVDTAEDLAFVRRLFEVMEDAEAASWLAIADALTAHPEVSALNRDIRQKGVRETDDRVRDDA